MNMETLLYGIGTSVQNAHQAIEHHATQHFFENYFVPMEEDDCFRPKMVKIELPPSKDAEGKTIYAPLAALIPHTGLNMDCVKIKLNMDILNETNGCLEVSAANAGSDTEDNRKSGELEITYKCTDSAEGLSRIETQLNSLL